MSAAGVALLLQVVMVLLAAFFALYVVVELRLVLAARRSVRAAPAEPLAPPETERDWPRVSVLLPVCNEAAVVERLIDAACALRYPVGSLEVLLLDDSDDHTSMLADARVAVHAAQGVDVRVLRRPDRRGFKAGNLAHAMPEAAGEFIVIFDADFVPPADFLLRTIPRFDDPSVGFLQTAIAYTNREASFLTRFQAMEMGHQQFVTTALARHGLMGSLTGSSCVWRRSCVDSLGGWSAETITEDVDIGYKAQLQQWRYVFVNDVVSQAELPESMGAVRVQRERWARGLIHNALRHFPRLWRAPMTSVERLHAVKLMGSAPLLASFFVLLLMGLPVVLVTAELGALFNFTSAMLLALVVVWVVCNFVGATAAGGRDEAPPAASASRGALHEVGVVLGYVGLFLAMSLYYFVGGLRALSGRHDEFNRTPKGSVQARSSMPAVGVRLALLEILTFGHAAATLALSLLLGNFWVTILAGLGSLGFGMALYFASVGGGAR